MSHKKHKWVVVNGIPERHLLTRLRAMATAQDPKPVVVWQLPKTGGTRWTEAFDTEVEATGYALERATQEISNLRQSILFTKAAIKKANDELIRLTRQSAKLVEDLRDATECASVLAEKLPKLMVENVRSTPTPPPRVDEPFTPPKLIALRRNRARS